MKALGLSIAILLFVTYKNPVSGQLQHTGANVVEMASAMISSGNISQVHFGSNSDPLKGLTITWKSTGAEDKIRWGYTINFEKGEYYALKRNQNANVLFDYAFPVLSEGSTIYYSLYDSKDSTWLVENTYITASGGSDNKFSFTAFGDSRLYPLEWKIISDAALDTDFTLFLGDFVSDGSLQSDWDAWFEYGENFISRELMYHTVGNHDIDASLSGYETYLNLFTMPGNELYYSFTHGNAIFLCFNSLDQSNPEQYLWLLSTLNSNSDKTWKFVFTHMPFYASPRHMGEMDSSFNTIWKAFDDFGVDMIFNGHVHNYLRTLPINRNISTSSPVASYGSGEGQGRCQVVAGNAGAPLGGLADSSLWWLAKTENKRHFCNIAIDGDKLSFKAIDANQVVFDELLLNKGINGFSHSNTEKINIFPNPSEGIFYLTTNDEETFSYRIFNSMGQMIRDVHQKSNLSAQVEINLMDQPGGIYYLEIFSNKGIAIEKIVLY